MTAISILSGDFEILLDDEKNQNGGTNAVAGMRTVQRASGASSTVYTTRALYSAVADAMDDFIAMGFTNAMLPTTPNAFTMENKYFIPRSSTEFLKEGAITANWTTTATPDTNGNGVIKVAYTGGTAFVAGDIGRQATQAGTGDTGTLLDFDVDPDGTTVAWIRPDDSTPSTGDTFDGTGALSVTGDGGTGASTSSTAGVTGTTQYSAIQVIGSVPTATEVYLYQDRIKMADSTGGFQWWATNTAVSLGIISILVRVQDMGTLVADGDVEVFARRYTSLYDNFRLNVAAGGFSALPLASAADINNTTGYRSMLTSSSSGTFNVGNGVYVGATFATATKKGIVTAVTGTNPTVTIAYYLVGDQTDFANTDSLKEYDYVAAGDGDATATVNGAPSANTGGPTDSAAGEGGTVTIALGTTDVDHTGDGVTEPYSVTVDTQGDVPIAKVYERMKYVTRRGAPNTDLFGAGVNVPGESYRGLDGIFEYDATGTATMTQGDDILTLTGGSTWTARLVAQNTTNSPTYITVTDQQTSVDSIQDNDVVQDETIDTVTIHGAGTLGITNFTSPKASPLGTFTGTQIFGARGVVYINPASADTQAYIVTDDLGNLNNPPNTVSYLVSNTASGDRVLVARDTGTSGIIDKDQFGGLAAPTGAFNGIGDQTIRVAGSVDSEVPQTGYVRIVETTKREEHRYVYSSRTTGASGEFTLKTGGSFTGTATAGTSTTVLEDTGQTFVTDGVEVGMLIRDTTNGDFYEITAVTDEDTLAIVQIFGTGGTFASGDAYEINRLIQNYATTDDVFDLILDAEATTTSIQNTFIKTLASDFGTVANVRQGKIILPFTLNQTQGDGSTTVTVVRQPDTIAQ